MKDCCKKSYDDGLQKGKEIGFKEKITFLENEIIAIQKTKIAELEKDRKKIADELEDIIQDWGDVAIQGNLKQILKRLRG